METKRETSGQKVDKKCSLSCMHAQKKTKEQKKTINFDTLTLKPLCAVIVHCQQTNKTATIQNGRRE